MKYFLSLFLVAVLISCADTTIKKEDILGAWEIVSAERDGKTTETLNGAYFEFDANDLLTTNLLGREESSPFEFNIERAQIVQKGSSHLSFVISELSDDEMRLQTSIREIPFNIMLSRID